MTKSEYFLSAVCHYTRSFPSSVLTCSGDSLKKVLDGFRRAFSSSRIEYAHVDVYKGAEPFRSYRFSWNENSVVCTPIKEATNG